MLLLPGYIFPQNVNNPRFYNKLAFQAYNEHDYKGFLKNMKRAYELSSTHQSYIYNLAIAYLLNHDREKALKLLEKGLSFGFVYPLDTDKDLDSLRDTLDFKSLLEQNLINQQPMEVSKTAAVLPAKQVIAEGVQYNPVDSSFFISSIYKGIIYNVNKENKILWQSTDSIMGSIAGLKIDYKKNILWGTFVNQPKSKYFIDSLNGNSGIFCYDLLTKEKRFDIIIKKDSLEKHWFGDLVLDSMGSIYASDSKASKIYKFSAPDFKPQLYLSDTNIVSLQGIDFIDNGNYMIFSDYVRGLFLFGGRTSLVKEIKNITGNTLLGIDGIYFYKKNKIIAVQNGINPQRIIEITLDESYTRAVKLKVLEVNNPDYDDVTLGTIFNDHFFFIANSQWYKFTKGGKIFDRDRFNDIIIKCITLD